MPEIPSAWKSKRWRREAATATAMRRSARPPRPRRSSRCGSISCGFAPAGLVGRGGELTRDVDAAERIGHEIDARLAAAHDTTPVPNG